ncbi:MAG TPA: TetR family transcriptional regulator [Rhizomicrobium sp.]
MSKAKLVPAAKRRKCAQTTRGAIMTAARKRFAAKGYENSGLRDIAADVGIDPALICRYFGGKQELLAEILAAQPDCAEILAGPLSEIGAGLAERILPDAVAGDDGAPTDLLIILRAASSSEAAPILRKGIEEKFTAPLQKRLEGKARKERALLAASFVLGTMVLHSLLKVDGGGTPRRDRETAKRLARVIQTVVDTRD